MEQAVVIRTRKRGALAARKIAQYFFLVLFALFFLFPFFVMISRSLMTKDEVLHRLPELLWSADPSFKAYASVFDRKFVTYLSNTLLIVGLNMVGQPLSAALCAFGFTKLRFRGRDAVFAVVLATIMLPSIAMQIPLYIVYHRLGWTNSILPLVVPGFFGGGVINIFLLKQFMRGIRNDMLEAARIDGANIVRIFCGIVMPLCKPVVLLIVINAFLANWNDYSGALIYLQEARSYTLSLALYYKFQSGLAGGVFANEMMAAGVMMTLPCAVLFFLFQKQLIDGVNIGGIKG